MSWVYEMKYADPYNTKTLADKMAGLIDRWL